MSEAKSIKLTDLKPDPANANRGTERGLRMLDDSLAQVGLGRSIVVDKDMNVIAGNKTLERAKDRGFEDAVIVHTQGDKLVVVVRDDMDLMDVDPNNPARRYAYYDNRVGQLDLDFDPEQLFADQQAGFDFDDLFTEMELGELFAGLEQDETPGDAGAALSRAEEWLAKWEVERGQVWTVGRHRVMCGDSYSQDDIDLLLDGKTPDMLNTDPPYGIDIIQPRNNGSAADSGGAKPFGSTSGNERKSGVAFRDARAEHGHVQHGAPSRNQIIQSNLYPVIEGDDRPFDPTPFIDFAPIVILWGANYFTDKLPRSSGWIVWDKREDITRNTFADCELAWSNLDKPARLFHHLWNGLHKGSQYGERRVHPTEKPIALFEEIGRMFCPDGVWVDLFAGSGAQIIAAERVGASCYAMEYEPLYVATILQRLTDLGLTPEKENAPI